MAILVKGNVEPYTRVFPFRVLGSFIVWKVAGSGRDGKQC
jgi:hypothetical protein